MASSGSLLMNFLIIYLCFICYFIILYFLLLMLLLFLLSIFTFLTCGYGRLVPLRYHLLFLSLIIPIMANRVTFLFVLFFMYHEILLIIFTLLDLPQHYGYFGTFGIQLTICPFLGSCCTDLKIILNIEKFVKSYVLCCQNQLGIFDPRLLVGNFEDCKCFENFDFVLILFFVQLSVNLKIVFSERLVQVYLYCEEYLIELLCYYLRSPLLKNFINGWPTLHSN